MPSQRNYYCASGAQRTNEDEYGDAENGKPTARTHKFLFSFFFFFHFLLRAAKELIQHIIDFGASQMYV